MVLSPKASQGWLVLSQLFCSRNNDVLSAEHCRARAERFRFWLLTAPDHATAARLRGFVERYNALAKRAEKAEALRFLAAGAAQFQGDPDEFLEKSQASSHERDKPPSLTQHLPTLSAAH